MFHILFHSNARGDNNPVTPLYTLVCAGFVYFSSFFSWNCSRLFWVFCLFVLINGLNKSLATSGKLFMAGKKKGRCGLFLLTLIHSSFKVPAAVQMQILLELSDRDSLALHSTSNENLQVEMETWNTEFKKCRCRIKLLVIIGLARHCPD